MAQLRSSLASPHRCEHAGPSAFKQASDFVAKFSGWARLPAEIRQRPMPEHTDYRVMQFRAGLMQGTGLGQAIRFLAEIPQNRALTRLNDRQQRDRIRRAIQDHPTGLATLGAQDAGPD